MHASAQLDIFHTLSGNGFGTPVFKGKPHPSSLFELCAELAGNEQFEIYQSNYFLGVVLGSVRTVLPDWVSSGQ